MSKTVAGFLALSLGAIAATSGCSRANAETVQAASAASPTPSPSPTASPTPQPSGPSPVAAIDFEKLIAFLPDAPGWTRATPTGQQITTSISYARATTDYSKGESLIRLEITDSGFNNLLLAPLSMMLVPSYWERSTDGYRKYAAMSGQPGFESWQAEANDAEVTVVVANRYIVNARGTSVPNVDAVRSVVQNIDLARLTSLK